MAVSPEQQPSVGSAGQIGSVKHAVVEVSLNFKLTLKWLRLLIVHRGITWKATDVSILIGIYATLQCNYLAFG